MAINVSTGKLPIGKQIQCRYKRAMEQWMRNTPELTIAGEWYRDRDEWVRHILGRDYLSPDCQRVGIFIAMHMNRRDNHTKHQQTTIAKDLNLNVRTVKRAIQKLCEQGLIDLEKATRGRRNRAVNHYFLIFPWKV